MKDREVTKAVNKAMEYAEEVCYDLRPIKEWTCTEIEVIWFKPDQLKELIRHCVELGKSMSSK